MEENKGQEVVPQERPTMFLEECARHLLGVRDTLELFNGKWKIPIMGAFLYLKEARFKELQRMVGGITSKVLSKELKELETNKMITRTVLDTKPVSVIYAITPYGETCKEIIIVLGEWGIKHREQLFNKTE